MKWHKVAQRLPVSGAQVAACVDHAGLLPWLHVHLGQQPSAWMQHGGVPRQMHAARQVRHMCPRADTVCAACQAAYADADAASEVLQAVAPVGVTRFLMQKLEVAKPRS